MAFSKAKLGIGLILGALWPRDKAVMPDTPTDAEMAFVYEWVNEGWAKTLPSAHVAYIEAGRAIDQMTAIRATLRKLGAA